MTETCSDAELIEALRMLEDKSLPEGAEAFSAVVQWLAHQARRLRGTAQKRNPDIVQDVADRIAGELYSNEATRAKVLSAGQPDALLRTMVRHQFLDLLRCRMLTDVSEDIAAEEMSSYQDPVDSLEQIDIADTVAVVSGELSAEERDLLRLRYWEDLSYGEIARHLGISYSSAAKRMNRLHAKLRAVLGASVPIRGSSRRSRASARFYDLAEAWRKRRDPTSSVSQMAMLQEYQAIIGMGPDVVPLLLGELQKEPDHWFWALAAITGEDPVAQEDKGRLPEMANAWIEWGRQHGHLELGAVPMRANAEHA